MEDFGENHMVFRGGTEGRSVVVNRVQVEDYRKLTGGIIRISKESWGRGGGNKVNFIVLLPKFSNSLPTVRKKLTRTAKKAHTLSFGREQFEGDC